MHKITERYFMWSWVHFEDETLYMLKRRFRFSKRKYFTFFFVLVKINFIVQLIVFKHNFEKLFERIKIYISDFYSCCYDLFLL